jgi:hypothetical protein
MRRGDEQNDQTSVLDAFVLLGKLARTELAEASRLTWANQPTALVAGRNGET